jgi:hypothetical protein
MRVLQSRLATANDETTGLLNPAKINGVINSIKSDWQKMHLTPADHVTPQDISTLADIARGARSASTNLTGLSPEGQMYMWRELKSRAEGTAAGSPQNVLLQKWEQQMSDQSPSLATHINQVKTTGKDLAARVADQESLKEAAGKLRNIVDNGGNLNAKNAQTNLGDLLKSGSSEGDVARQFLSDLQTKAAVDTGGLKGNVPSYGGLLGRVMGHKVGDVAAWTSLLHGNLLHAATAFAAKHMLQKGQAGIDSAAVDLTRHGNALKFADALERVNK